MTGYGQARASSVFEQRSARQVLKRRDKPYKAELTAPTQKKRKLDVHVSYTAPPHGFVFVPLGTPELADLCKEISSQNGYPVNIVHAKPASKTVMDPAKVSHHIQRIGYHFRAEAVERACRQLKYSMMDGKFISEADLQKRQHASVIAAAMAKVGLQVTNLEHTKETSSQVAAAIKELFPSIPDNDLEEVVKHAWEEGSSRVGTIEEIDLSRRVQLAVIARIRHEYTDYDRLLKAFGWATARQEVEADCLKKLIEWRGEEGEDGGLEEIVRETIVNDDDAPRIGVAQHGTPTGDASDTSIEISHRPAMANDLRAESPREHLYRQLHRRPNERSFSERNDIARAKIDAMRGQMRAQAASRPPPGLVTRINIDTRQPAPDEIIIDGVRMRRAPPDSQHVAPPRQPQLYLQPQYPSLGTVQAASYPRAPTYTQQPPAYIQSQSQFQTQAQVPPYPPAQPQQVMYRPQDVPMQSIEASRTGPEHRRATSATTNGRHDTFSPRHGEPAYLQYRQSAVTNASQPQVPPSNYAQPWIQPAPQVPYTTFPVSYSQIPQYTAPPSATQPAPIQQYLPQYPPLPRHGAPAPIQPAYTSSNAPLPQPGPPQNWYAR